MYDLNEEGLSIKMMENKNNKQSKRSGGKIGNVKVGVRLFVAFSFIIICVSILAGVSTKGIGNMATQVALLNSADDVSGSLYEVALAVENYQLIGSEEVATEVDNKIDAARLATQSLDSAIDQETLKEEVAKVFSEIDGIPLVFKEFREVETEKIQKMTMRKVSAEYVMGELESALEGQKTLIEDAADVDAMNKAIEIFYIIEASRNTFGDVQTYSANFTTSNLDVDKEALYGALAVTRESLEASELVANDAVKLKIHSAIIAVGLYEDALDSYVEKASLQEIKRLELIDKMAIALDVLGDVEEEILTYIDSETKSVTITNGVFVAFVIVFSLVIGVLLALSIIRPLKQVVSYMDKLAEYDISTDIPMVLTDRKDEMGLLARALQKAQANLRLIIMDINKSSEQLTAASQELASTSHQSSERSMEVAKTVEEIANGASEQAKDTETGVDNVTELGNMIEQDEKDVTKLNQSAITVKELKDQGVSILKKLVEQTNASNVASSKVSDIVNETNISANQIAKASQMIQNIADQTNLLALNAAIEAARAGEAGKGFAVVAEEIRKLAEQSNKFTKEIAKVIKNLIEKSVEAVETIDESSEIAKEQNVGVIATNNKFEGISEALINMEQMIEAVYKSSGVMMTKRNQIIGVMENLASISEENAAATEEVSATMEEQTALMNQIEGSADSLAQMADHMLTTVSKFNI